MSARAALVPVPEPVLGAGLAAAMQGGAAEDPLESRRRRCVQVLAERLAEARLLARKRLEGGAGGVETARLLSRAADEAVRALCNEAARAAPGGPLTLMAVGGYGRGVLAPYSDLDLLFLHPPQAPAEDARIEFVLHGLWDLGFKVGHASRTVAEALKLAKSDMTVRTAVLESRRLAGEETLASELQRRFRKEIVKGTAAEFVSAKLRERDERHAKAGASRYLVEPNVKEGKGGLRDLHTLVWITRYLHPDVPLDDLVRLDFVSPKEARAFLRAFDFLWRVRLHLHFAAGRAQERLTFDLQPQIARCMGHGDKGDAPAVERFMRRYFLYAREVGALTRTFCAKLEADHAKAPQGLSRFIPRVRRRGKVHDADFVEQAGRLTIARADAFERNPVNLLRLFRLLDRHGLDLHPDAATAVARTLPRLIGIQGDAEAARLFLDVLARGRHTQRTLTLMNETGVLGWFLPEFGRVVGQMQYNMYHAYTVDEHTLRAVGVIADIAAGRLEQDHPLSTSLFPAIADREALFLAMLLHDTGKGDAEGQQRGGARIARQACLRLGVAPARAELVAWLVEHHLVMSDFAQKRDVADPGTVAAFARIVESPERLRLLLVLTVADIRAVGPGVWNGWKGQLLRELYAATEAVFRGGRSTDPATSFRRWQAIQAEQAREALRKRDPAAGAWADSMEDAYFGAIAAPEQLVHSRLAREAEGKGGAAALARLHTHRNAAEIVIAAPDRPGLFADFAGVLDAHGADVVGARIYTSEAGQALDAFYVQDPSGEPFGGSSPAQLKRLARALEAAATGQAVPRRAAHVTSPVGRRAAFSVDSTVAVDASSSERAAIVEVSGRDRPGLLAELARTLSEAGLSIRSAHVEGYGLRVVDVFYVRQGDGSPLVQPARISRLKRTLTDVLEAGEIGDERPGPSERVRASVAR